MTKSPSGPNLRAPLQLSLGHTGVVPGEGGLREDHAALENLVVPSPQDRERDDIQHFVGDHQAADLLRQAIDPLEAVEVIRKPLRQALALPRLELGADFQQ